MKTVSLCAGLLLCVSAALPARQMQGQIQVKLEIAPGCGVNEQRDMTLRAQCNLPGGRQAAAPIARISESRPTQARMVDGGKSQNVRLITVEW
ncbi:hypothetical protein FJU30_24255 [Affinibrenneria salicis]|uniref:Uncharacterized protein n=1 Tax=Affinibrenneria salicis TaxID=2590031 RepID=A0A5J5FQZ6_9GAMM|nr:hypothetical protein [Affinibrenneria salicis]KAA8995502.1 hypothetical protein FJU30_24255 [Affinibrenneria salicis]